MAAARIRHHRKWVESPGKKKYNTVDQNLNVILRTVAINKMRRFVVTGSLFRFLIRFQRLFKSNMIHTHKRLNIHGLTSWRSRTHKMIKVKIARHVSYYTTITRSIFQCCSKSSEADFLVFFPPTNLLQPTGRKEKKENI